MEFGNFPLTAEVHRQRGLVDSTDLTIPVTVKMNWNEGAIIERKYFVSQAQNLPHDCQKASSIPRDRRGIRQWDVEQ